MAIKHSKNPTLQLMGARLSFILKMVTAKVQGLLSQLHRVGMDQDIRWTRQFAARLLRVLVLAGMSVPVNQIPVRASALTYTTILSFVPLMVILSAVAGHLGYLDLLSHLVVSLADSMNLDINLDPVLRMIEVAQKVDFHRLGLVGSLGLLFTFFLSMSNIELAMDQIWDIRKERNWWRQLKEFTPFLILLILLVLGVGNVILKYRAFLDAKFSGASVPHLVHETVLLFSTISVIGFIWLGLVMLFYLIPNTKVRLSPAILAASLSTGAIFLLTRILTYFPNLFVSRSSFIYGSLAVVPVALLMIYLMWLIVLYGAAVGFIYQRLYHPRDKVLSSKSGNHRSFHRMEKEVFDVLRAVHALSGSKALEGRKIVTLEKLAAELWDDKFSIEALAAPLVDLGLLAKRRIRNGCVYAPRIPLAEVDLTALHNLLLKLDPKGTGKLRVQTSIDELNHTLGILYSSGKRNPPLYLNTVFPDMDRERKPGQA